jgi:hypothetical protein
MSYLLFSVPYRLWSRYQVWRAMREYKWILWAAGEAQRAKNRADYRVRKYADLSHAYLLEPELPFDEDEQDRWARGK